MSRIVRFQEDVNVLSANCWKEAERKMLSRFDEWRQKNSPHILSVQFGRVDSPVVLEGEHYTYLSVFVLD